MKSIWAFLMTAATVTVYVHVRHKEPIVTPVRRAETAAERPASAIRPSGDIVVAPYAPGTVGERWGSEAANPPPQGRK